MRCIRLVIPFCSGTKESRGKQPQRREEATEQQSLERAIRCARARRSGRNGYSQQCLHDRDAEHGPRHACRSKPSGEPAYQRRHDQQEKTDAIAIIANNCAPHRQDRRYERDGNSRTVGTASARVGSFARSGQVLACEEDGLVVARAG